MDFGMPRLPDMTSFIRTIRLQSYFRAMSRPHQDQILSMAEELHQEQAIDDALSKQLHNEIQATLRKADGVNDSLLYQLLPHEIRTMVFRYVVVVPEQVHVFAPYDNDQHGYRLSRCGEDGMDEDFGRCRCENGRPFGGAVLSEFLDTALLLVSKTVRREALDLLFTQNHFTFTRLPDLTQFATLFRTSAAKLQHIRLYERGDDYPVSDFRSKQITKTRKRIGTLSSLDIRLYLQDWTQYEKIHEDAYLNELVCFAMPPPVQFDCKVRFPGRLTGRRTNEEESMCARVEVKLRKVFTGYYGDDVSNVPFSDPPPQKVQEQDRPLKNRMGIIALRD